MSDSINKITIKLSELSPEQRQLLQQILDNKQPESKRKSTINNYSTPLDYADQRRQLEELPLSFSQERLWFFEQFHKNSCTYNTNRRVKLTGNLNISVLEKALETIIQRHETLRTNFYQKNGITLQEIQENPQFKLAVIDLNNFPLNQKEEQLNKLLYEEIRKPFNLSEDLMLRAFLYCLNEKEYIFLVIMHHIASDGWSLGVFTQELNQLYNAFSKNEPYTLPKLPLQYADFSLWQRNWYQDNKLESQLNYWREKFQSNIPILNLPTDRPRPSLETFNGSLYPLKISPNLTSKLKQLSKQLKVTLFMVLLTAFKILLYRYTAEEDIVLGTPIAGRNHLEIEGLIGFFVNTLALKTNLSGNLTFEELLKRVQQTAQQAYIHQELPYEKLIQELELERDLSRGALTQVLFSFQNTPETSLQLSELEVSSYGINKTQTKSNLSLSSYLNTPDNGTARCDLTLLLKEEEGEIGGIVEYNTDLFAAERIKRLVAHFQVLLAGIVENTQQNISYLPLLTPEEKHQLLVEWNDTATDYPRDKCIHQLFEEQVEKTPDAVAVVFKEQQLTYRELNEKANQLAHYLQKQGVRTETLVGISIERSLEMLIGILGILKAGGTYVPLDANYPSERLAFMLSDTQVSVLLTQQSLRGKLPASKTQIICLNNDGDKISTESKDNPTSLSAVENLAYITYTSGSTGQPKGVCVTHRGVVRLVKNTNYANFTSEEIFLQLAAISFDASTWEIWGSLLNGGRLVIFPPHNPSLADLGTAIREYQITTLWLTAGLFSLMVDECLEDLKPLRQLFTGGDVLSTTHVQKFVQEVENCRLINGYGPTENTTFTCCYPISKESPLDNSVPIGRPISNTQVYLLDEYLNPVPVGVRGELYIGGDGLARGYWQRPELTLEKFIPNPFGEGKLYKTGDLARYLADGKIEFLGRIDDQVKIRGFRIELGEIETNLVQHPRVKETLVIARDSQHREQYLTAYLIPQDEQKLEIAELRQFLREKLPEYMIPSAFVFLDAFPLTPNGKIDRKALPDQDFAANRESEFIAPCNQIEIKLAQIWQEVFGIEKIGINDNFFTLGGHSLLATQVISRIRNRFQVDLPLRYLFESPTIGQLGEYLAKLDDLKQDYPIIIDEDVEEIEL